MLRPVASAASVKSEELLQLFHAVRRQTCELSDGLSDADATAQSMPDASPAKWHLAHTSWFFEAMVLSPHQPRYREYDPRYGFLFNSYYEGVGPRHSRPKRGLLTRPTLAEILAYRRHVDEAMGQFLERDCDMAVRDLVQLGCHHEQQHQELLLTDILHLFAQNPLQPAHAPVRARPRPVGASGASTYTQFPEAIVGIGHGGRGFAFDCEGPRHRVVRPACRLADRCVTNREWLQFISDGGYREPLLWLSDGWSQVLQQAWSAPLYWWEQDGAHFTMTLHGAQPLDLDAPATHISYYEADAFARWAGKRLPTEQEWEAAAEPQPCVGNFADSGLLQPAPVAMAGLGLQQLFGDVWEWTASAFSAYPGYRPAAGAVGEYNGKFMCGQYVLRGGSCVTPVNHIRASYRNFFRPDARWQFSGVRLAEDA